MARSLTTEHRQAFEREGVEIEVTVVCPWHRENCRWEPGEITAYDARHADFHLTQRETEFALEQAVIERDAILFP